MPSLTLGFLQNPVTVWPSLLVAPAGARWVRELEQVRWGWMVDWIARHADWGDVPAWAALLVAIGALVVSWRAMRRSTQAADRSAAADERNAHHLDQPRFTATIENMGGWYRLVLRLDGPIDVHDRVDVMLLGESLTFRQALDGIDRDAPYPAQRAWAPVYTQTAAGTPTVQPGEMKIGEQARWRIERVGDRTPATVLLRVDARDAGRTWSSLLHVDVPAALQTDDLGIVH